MIETDVVIIGAGPTGLALACQLIRYGVDFVIIDKKETTTPYSRAIGVQARTLEIYEQMDLAKKLISLGRPAEKVRMLEGGKVRGEAVLKDIGAGMSEYPFLLIVEQGKHETMLYDYIREHGADVRWQNELLSFTQDDAGVTAQVVGPSGKEETIKAKYLVGCDGPKSLVRHTLGMTFEGDTVERMFYVADVRVDWEFSHDALHVCLAKHTITAFFPMPGENRYRIVGTFPDGYEGNEGDILYDEIERQIAADAEMVLDISEVNWFSVYRVHSRAVNKFSEGRCFVAGDSAHIHTPAGAQGMNTGIQDAYNLAWKLAEVVRGRAVPALLETYNEERLPNARRLLKTTDRIFELGASDEWFISYVRTHIIPYVIGFALTLDVVKNMIFPLVSQIGIHYRESSLSQDETGFDARAGDRMPYFRLGHSIYDDLREPKFHVIAFGGDGALKLGAELEDMVDSHFFPLSQEVMEGFGANRAFIVLLRPDNYIGLISERMTAEAVNAYLETTLGG